MHPRRRDPAHPTLLSCGGGAVRGPGAYSGALTLATFDDADDSRTILDTRHPTFQAAVNAQGAIYVSLHGDATTGSGKWATPAAINFAVQYDGGYRYRVTSDDDGRRRLLNPLEDTNVFKDFIRL